MLSSICCIKYNAYGNLPMKSCDGESNGRRIHSTAADTYTHGERLPMAVAMARTKHGTYFELSEETLMLIERIKTTTGLPKNKVVELAIRELAADRTVYRQLSIEEFLRSKKAKQKKTEGQNGPPPGRKSA
jgi:hypothetical protein